MFGTTNSPSSSSSSIVSSATFSFGNANSSQNPVASNAFATKSFGNTSNSYYNPSAPNIFGNSSNLNQNRIAPNSLGNTSNSNHNLFAPNAFGNTSNPNQNPFAFNASGNTSISNDRLYSFTTNAFGNTSSPSRCPFAPNLFSKASDFNHKPFAASSFGTTTSTYGGHSAGVFGASSPASSVFTFEQPTSFSGSSVMLGTTSIGIHGPFGSTTSRGPFGGPSYSANSGIRNVPERASVSSAMVGLNSKNSATASQTISSDFGKINSSVLKTTPVYPFSSCWSATSPSIPTGLLQPICGQNKGSRINSYRNTMCISDGLGCKLLSISAMPFYESKSHEELRWEDYKLKSRGQPNSVSKQELGIREQKFEIQLFPSVTSSLSTISTLYTNPDIARKLNTPNYSIPCLSSPDPSLVFPALLNKTPASNGVGCDQVATITNNQRIQNLPLPSNDSPYGQVTTNIPQQYNASSVIQMTTPSTLTASSASAGNNMGVSLDIGESQPSLPQLNFTLSGVKVKESIIAVKDPFGSECGTTSQPSTGLSACSFVRHGISSMPVGNKPEKTRVSSLLTSKHHSLKPLVVNIRKYHPKSDIPKVPFFDQVEKIQITSRPYSYISPRENPRAVFAAASADHASAKEYADGTNNSKKDQINTSTPNSLNNHFAKANDNSKEVTEQLIPKLQRSDYYTDPEIKKLASFESANPGFCCHVKDFVVGRYGYGWLKFYGETDVRGLDLDSLIHFKDHEVLVYDDDCEKPPVGQGLNKAAEITLLNIHCIDKKTGKQYISGKMVDNFIEKLKKVAEKQNTEFVAYDSVNGEWKFSVQHF